MPAHSATQDRDNGIRPLPPVNAACLRIVRDMVHVRNFALLRIYAEHVDGLVELPRLKHDALEDL